MTDTEGNPELQYIDDLSGISERVRQEVLLKKDGESLTAEQMAERMGVPMAELGEVLSGQIAFYRELAEKLSGMFGPDHVQPLNRAARRLVAGKGPKRARAMMAAKKTTYPR